MRNNTNDVTDIVQAIATAAEEGRVHFTINNKLFAVGNDPVKLEEKNLEITYVYAGTKHTITVHEYKDLSLP